MNKLTFFVWLVLSSGISFAQVPKTIDKGTPTPVSDSIKVQEPTQTKAVKPDLNQVFVKVILPVTSSTPKQDGPIVESWIAEQLKQQGESEYFAATDWVPICDGLLANDVIDNDVWDGQLNSNHSYCAVGGDIPERENGRLLVSVAGWSPASGCEARISLADEPGNRAVVPVQFFVGPEKKPVKFKADDRLPYVAVLICPPPTKPAAVDHKTSVDQLTRRNRLRFLRASVGRAAKAIQEINKLQDCFAPS